MTSHSLHNHVDFPHQPPEGYSYEIRQFKPNMVSIWINHHASYVHKCGESVNTIWGFKNTRTGEYYAPINSTKRGDKVNINNTTPFTAMQRKLNPLEALFYGV